MKFPGWAFVADLPELLNGGPTSLRRSSIPRLVDCADQCTLGDFIGTVPFSDQNNSNLVRILWRMCHQRQLVPDRFQNLPTSEPTGEHRSYALMAGRTMKVRVVRDSSSDLSHRWP